MTTRELMEQKKSRSITDLDDGFSGYTCETEGDTVDERPNSLLQGKRIKFDGRSNKWTVDGVPMPKDFQLLAVKTLRAVLKWGKDKSLPPHTNCSHQIRSSPTSTPRTRKRRSRNGSRGQMASLAVRIRTSRCSTSWA